LHQAAPRGTERQQNASIFGSELAADFEVSGFDPSINARAAHTEARHTLQKKDLRQPIRHSSRSRHRGVFLATAVTQMSQRLSCQAQVRGPKGITMARCHRCGSHSVVMGYCRKCRSLDPFPWRRRLLYAAAVAVWALVILALLSFASR